MNLKINRDVVKILSVLVIAILLIVLFFFGLSKWMDAKKTSNLPDDSVVEDGRVYIDGVCYLPKKGLTTTLLLGVDKYTSETKADSYNNSQQTDFLLLLIMNRKTESYTAIQLNRDTMAEIPILGVRGEDAGSITAQLALAHTYGTGKEDSCRNAVKAVSGFLYGVEIDHYVSFTMDAVAKVNDTAGGVTVTVLDDLTSVLPEMKKGATLTLSGEMAMSYVRARAGLEDSSNLRRMERQRQYLNALRETVKTKVQSDDAFLLDALNDVAPYIVSDCTINELASLYENWNTFTDGGIQTIAGEAKVGEEFMEFYPDEAAVKQLVIDLFYTPVEE